MVNNPCGWIALSSYGNLGEEFLRFGRTILTWCLTQASSVIIEANVCVPIVYLPQNELTTMHQEVKICLSLQNASAL